jgi:hypothetical protein
MKKTKRDRKPIRRHTARLHPPPPPHNVTTTHNYYSKMVFDGKTLRTESKQDDKPIKRRKYTLKDLEKEIPIGAELVKEYLDYKVPRGLEEPLPKNAVFQSVLPNPDDLGLMPPKIRTRKHRPGHRRLRQEQPLQLIINEKDANERSSSSSSSSINNIHDLP